MEGAEDVIGRDVGVAGEGFVEIAILGAVDRPPHLALDVGIGAAADEVGGEIDHERRRPVGTGEIGEDVVDGRRCLAHAGIAPEDVAQRVVPAVHGLAAMIDPRHAAAFHALDLLLAPGSPEQVQPLARQVTQFHVLSVIDEVVNTLDGDRVVTVVGKLGQHPLAGSFAQPFLVIRGAGLVVGLGRHAVVIGQTGVGGMVAEQLRRMPERDDVHGDQVLGAADGCPYVGGCGGDAGKIRVAFGILPEQVEQRVLVGLCQFPRRYPALAAVVFQNAECHVGHPVHVIEGLVVGILVAESGDRGVGLGDLLVVEKTPQGEIHVSITLRPAIFRGWTDVALDERFTAQGFQNQVPALLESLERSGFAGEHHVVAVAAGVGDLPVEPARAELRAFGQTGEGAADGTGTGVVENDEAAAAGCAGRNHEIQAARKRHGAADGQAVGLRWHGAEFEDRAGGQREGAALGYCALDCQAGIGRDTEGGALEISGEDEFAGVDRGGAGVGVVRVGDFPSASTGFPEAERAGSIDDLAGDLVVPGGSAAKIQRAATGIDRAHRAGEGQRAAVAGDKAGAGTDGRAKLAIDDVVASHVSEGGPAEIDADAGCEGEVGGSPIKNDARGTADRGDDGFAAGPKAAAVAGFQQAAGNRDVAGERVVSRKGERARSRFDHAHRTGDDRRDLGGDAGRRGDRRGGAVEGERLALDDVAASVEGEVVGGDAAGCKTDGAGCAGENGVVVGAAGRGPLYGAGAIEPVGGAVCVPGSGTASA